MKKIIFIIFVLSITTQVYSQTLNEKIRGNWYHCDKDLGYIEMAVYDTILFRKFMLNDFVSNSPLIYGVKDNKIVINPGYSDISETIKVDLINKETIILSGFTYNKDTLHLIKKDIPDYSTKSYCEMEMTPTQYSEYLRSEYRLRWIKNRHKCISPFYKKIKEVQQQQPVDNEQLPKEIIDFFADTTRISATSSFIDYKIINKIKSKNKKTEFVELIQNTDNNGALLIIDLWGKCYTDYNHHVDIINDEMIDVILKPREFGCNKKCRKRLYIYISLENYKIKGVKFNGEKIK